MSTWICEGCGNIVDYTGVYVDNVGIGAYEFWGVKGHDDHYVLISYCCDEEVIDMVTKDPIPVWEFDDYNDDYEGS